MNYSQFEKSLETIDLDNEQIKEMADYCIANNAKSELEVSKIIDKCFFQQSDPRVKCSLFLLISEILFLAKATQNKLFFKHLSPKIKPFIEGLENHLLEDEELALIIVTAIEKWENAELFAYSFMERIRQAIGPILTKHSELINKQKKDSFTKYTKEFLMEQVEIRKLPLTSRIYLNYVETNKIKNSLSILQKACRKVNAKNPTSQEVEQVNELLQEANSYFAPLEELICNLHQELRVISDEFAESFSQLQLEK